jgi:CheY-like chemotaxis protein/two-component sensor histidine kinase
MEAIGRLAGGVAHDFNNLLTAINGHARLLLEDLPAGSQLANDARQILSAGDRAIGLTRQLLAFSRKQVMEQRAVDLRRLAGDMEQMLRRLIPAPIELVLEAEDQPVIARADPSQLGQVLMNLVVNAVDAIEVTGRITLRVGHASMTPELAAEIPWTVRTGRYAQLTVQDTGSGIPDHVMDQIFEPFFTTKSEGRGTGLGLSTVYGIVKQSGGHVLVDSEPGVGTTFRVLLPVAADVPEEPVEEQELSRMPRGATILLVEDDVAVRTLATRVLERLGCRVLTATNGREALEIADANPDIDLVLSDVVMPEMSGGELVDRLRAAHPDMKVVLTSGYSEADLQGEVRQRGAAFLAKPFTPESLQRVIADVLGA